MKILHIIKKLDFGGAENYACDVCNESAKRHEVFVLAGEGRKQKELNENIVFIPIKFSSPKFFSHIIKIVKIIKENKIDIIHAHQRHPILLATIAGKIAGIPAIATLHGKFEHDLRGRWTRRNVSAIIAVNINALQQLQKFKYTRDLCYIPNGIDMQRPRAVAEGNRISYISRIDDRHGSLIVSIINDVIPKLIDSVPDLTFHISGDGAYIEKVRQAASICNTKYGREICLVKGYCSNIANEINKSRIVMGVGRVAVESIANYVPLLSVNKIYIGDIVTTENVGYYMDNNFVNREGVAPTAEVIISKLQHFFSTPERWESQMESVHNTVAKRYDMTTNMKRIEELYERHIVKKR